MSNTIWKFELKIQSEQVIEMPKYAKILTVQLQRGIPCIWASVNPRNNLVEREILTCGTGAPLPDVDAYIGTYQLSEDNLVFHVFEGSYE